MAKGKVTTKKSKKKVSYKDAIGKWVRTVWSDTGARDGVVVGVIDDEGYDLDVFFPDYEEIESVDSDQIIQVGAYAFYPCFSKLTGMDELKESLDNPFYM